jgi:hypothetical protein
VAIATATTSSSTVFRGGQGARESGQDKKCGIEILKKKNQFIRQVSTLVYGVLVDFEELKIHSNGYICATTKPGQKLAHF